MTGGSVPKALSRSKFNAKKNTSTNTSSCYSYTVYQGTENTIWHLQTWLYLGDP